MPFLFSQWDCPSAACWWWAQQEDEEGEKFYLAFRTKQFHGLVIAIRDDADWVWINGTNLKNIATPFVDYYISFLRLSILFIFRFFTLPFYLFIFFLILPFFHCIPVHLLTSFRYVVHSLGDFLVNTPSHVPLQTQKVICIWKALEKRKKLAASSCRFISVFHLGEMSPRLYVTTFICNSNWENFWIH